MIAVIDYGVGKLRSVASAFEAIDQHPLIIRRPGDLAKAGAIELYGGSLQRWHGKPSPLRSDRSIAKEFLSVRGYRF